MTVNALRWTGAVAFTALVAAGAAQASTLRVSAPGTIAVGQDAGVYRTTVLVPAAYTLRTVRVHGQAAVTGATGTTTGTVTSVDPTAYDDDACAANVGYDHLAVWLIHLPAASIPVYVDAGPGGTTSLTWCAPAVQAMSLRVPGAFAGPVAHGVYVWRALFDAGRTTEARSVVHD